MLSSKSKKVISTSISNQASASSLNHSNHKQNVITNIKTAINPYTNIRTISTSRNIIRNNSVGSTPIKSQSSQAQV